MTQDAIVTKVFSTGLAEVAVTRATACGGNCPSCESCIYQNEIKAIAKNAIGATEGQHVVIESKSSKIYGAVMLVYIMPLILFVAGYAISAALGASEGASIVVSFAALILSGVILVARERLLKKSGKSAKFDYDIVEIK